MVKFKRFQPLSDVEMKAIVGGYNAPGDGLSCTKTCYKYDSGSGSMNSDKCKAVSTTVGGATVESCECSLSGASSQC